MGVIKVWDGTQWLAASGGGGSAVYVGPSAPSGTPKLGDEWFDTDETSPTGTTVAVANGGTGATTASGARTNLGINLPLGLADGGTGGTTAATARSALTVPAIGNSTSTAGAPTSGTWARGDQWLDSANVTWVCTTGGTPGTWIFVGTNARAVRRIPTGTNTIVNTSTFIVLPVAADRTALQIAFTKRMASTRLLASLTASCYFSAGSAQILYSGLAVGGGAQTWEIAQRHTVNAAGAWVDMTGFVEIAGLAAGGYTFEPVFRSSTASAQFLFDPNWAISYSICEVP